MKKIYFILLATFCAVAVSCEKFLAEIPATSVSETTAYATAEALETQICGCYKMLYDVKLYMGHMQEEIHTTSFLVAPGKNLSDNGTISITKMTKFSNRVYMYNLYSSLYFAVHKCNTLIEHLADSPVEASYKKEIEAEARFLRGVLYFTLVRLFGDVPLWLETPETYQDVYMARTPYQKVYKAILADFNFAEENMRDPVRAVEIGGIGNGRVNKWAATAYKSAVYMQVACLMEFKNYQFFDLSKDGREPDFTDDDPALDIPTWKQAWRLCLDCAERVIKEGPYALADHYGKLFSWTDPQDWMLDERIFCLQSNEHVSGSLLSLWSLPPFPEGTANTSSANSNWGKFRPSRFLYQTWCETYGGKKGTVAGKNSDIYVSCNDPRLDLSFIHNGYTRMDTEMTQEVYPAPNRILSHDATSWMPYLRKYLSPNFNASSGEADLYMMRLAEMYLTAAEACAELSGGVGDSYWQKAMDYIEVLHARARKSVPEDKPESLQPKWESNRFATKDQLVNAIMWEREFELCGEGHEYFDTHRRGAKYMVEQICIPVNDHLQKAEQADFYANGADQLGYWSTVYYKTLAPTSVDAMRQSVVCALPEMEIRYNLKISDNDQNDFYWQ